MAQQAGEGEYVEFGAIWNDRNFERLRYKAVFRTVGPGTLTAYVILLLPGRRYS